MSSSERRYDTARYDAQRVRDAQRAREAGRRLQTAPSEPSRPRSSSRRRQRRRSGWIYVLRFVLWVAFVAAASLALSGVGWLMANDFCAFNKAPLTATVEVTKDDDLETVTEKLKEEGLIEYPWLFKLFGKVAHAESKIGIGTYELNTEMDYSALINGMRNNNAALNSSTVRVVIPEGYTVKQIIALLAKYGVSTESELTEAAENYDFEYSFLKGSSKGDIVRLEGYLFPDTYEFYVNGNPATALAKMLDNFGNKIDDAELAEKIEASPYSLSQLITIASLIEKETDGSDRENIASVIYNRLNNVGETYHLLQIDASQIYGLGSRYSGKLTREDLNIDTPYNTHIHEGLPPTPIANPGLASIRAALEPAETGYYYYALGKDGKHHFFTNYDKFLEFVSGSQYAG